jgi:hypothetical protein
VKYGRLHSASVSDVGHVVEQWFEVRTCAGCRVSDTLATFKAATLFWLDDDYRISKSVSVIFGGGVGRIVQPYTIYQELVCVLAGC